MKITTKGCYGLRAMLELASCHDRGPVSMEAIATSRDISRKYLHALLTSLRSAGLVRSSRGPGGGYVLARPARDINVRDILVALEGPLSPSACVDEPSICDRSGVCPMLGLWSEVAAITERILEGVTLAALAARETQMTSEG